MKNITKCLPTRKDVKRKALKNLAKLFLLLDRSAVGRYGFSTLFTASSLLSLYLGAVESADAATLKFLAEAYTRITLSGSAFLSGQVVGIPFAPQSASGSSEVVNIKEGINLATQPIDSKDIAHQRLVVGLVLFGINAAMLAWQSVAAAAEESVKFYETESANRLDRNHSHISNKGIRRNYWVNWGVKAASYTLFQLSVIMALCGAVMYKIEDGVQDIGLIQKSSNSTSYSGNLNIPLPNLIIDPGTSINSGATIGASGESGYEFYAGPDFRDNLENDGLFRLGWAAALFSLMMLVNGSKCFYDYFKRKRNIVNMEDLETNDRTTRIPKAKNLRSKVGKWYKEKKKKLSRSNKTGHRK